MFKEPTMQQSVDNSQGTSILKRDCWSLQRNICSAEATVAVPDAGIARTMRQSKLEPGGLPILNQSSDIDRFLSI